MLTYFKYNDITISGVLDTSLDLTDTQIFDNNRFLINSFILRNVRSRVQVYIDKNTNLNNYTFLKRNKGIIIKGYLTELKQDSNSISSDSDIVIIATNILYYGKKEDIK